MSDLAAQTDLSTSGVTRIVDRLEKAGLVYRDSPAQDRRGYWAILTDAGLQRLREDIPSLLETIQRCFVDPLSDREMSQLTRALRRLRDALRPAAAQTSP